MAVGVDVVAAALRERLPDVPTKKLHKLLYYCQGHHLAATGRALFMESLSAWDMGPVVGQFWHEEKNRSPATSLIDTAGLDEAQLNTIGYVVHRYGRLTGRDLEHLTHAETPWRRANEGRVQGESARIELSWLREYFGAEAVEEDPPLDPAAVQRWLASAEQRTGPESAPDDLERLRARLAHAT